MGKEVGAEKIAPASTLLGALGYASVLIVLPPPNMRIGANVDPVLVLQKVPQRGDIFGVGVKVANDAGGPIGLLGHLISAGLDEPVGTGLFGLFLLLSDQP